MEKLVWVELYGYTSIANDNTAQRQILNCKNSGNISGEYRVGGICGGKIAGAVTLISKSYNTGKITATTREIGGIIGAPTGEGGELIIEYCYNIGNIEYEGDETLQYAGGIIGRSYLTTLVKNSYSIGNIPVGTNCAGIVGHNLGSIQRCYYTTVSASKLCGTNEGTVDAYSLPKSQDGLKTEETLTSLNTGASQPVWKKDEQNINKGYPILDWQ